MRGIDRPAGAHRLGRQGHPRGLACRRPRSPLRPGAPLASHADHRHGITAHALSADRRTLFLAWRTAFPETYGLFRYDTTSHAHVPWGGTHDHAAWALAAHPTADLLAVGEDIGAVVRTIDLNPGHDVEQYAHLRHGARCAAFSTDGTRLAVGVGFGEDNAHVRLLEFPTGARLGGVQVGHEEVTGVCFSPGTRDRILFTGRHCRGAQLYEWHVRADGGGPAG